MKRVHIRSFSGPYSPALGLNTERYRVCLQIQSDCGKIQTRKIPNTDAFHAVYSMQKRFLYLNSFLLLQQKEWRSNQMQIKSTSSHKKKHIKDAQFKRAIPLPGKITLNVPIFCFSFIVASLKDIINPYNCLLKSASFSVKTTND